MTDLPEPLVPAEVSLGDFPFMPLDVQRVRDSGLASEETPEACWAALLLWCTSWHQVPAGSIPDSDAWQAKHAGYVARGRIDKAWADVKAGALRNWVLCSDGRLYHPVVAEKALTAWAEKLAQRARTKAATEAREAKRRAQQGQRDDQRDVAPDPNVTLKHGERDDQRNDPQNQSKGQGQGQGQGISSVPDGTDGAAAPAAGPSPNQLPNQPPAPPALAAPPPPPAKPERSPEDRAKATLWKAAVAVLQEGGCPSEDVARSFMGKLVKDYGLEVAKDAVAAAATAQPADAREYLRATCQSLVGQRKREAEAAVTVPSRAAEQTQDYLAQQQLTPAEKAAAAERAAAIRHGLGLAKDRA